MAPRPRIPTLGTRRVAAPSALIHAEAGGARFPMHTALFASVLSFEGAFSGVVDSLIQENCSGGKPETSQISMVLLVILPICQALFFWKRV